MNLINNLINKGVYLHNKIERDNKLTNKNIDQKNFVITGIIEGYTRDQIIEDIENNGGLIKNSISVKIDYLIAGKKAGSKLDKANKIGIKILDKEGLMQLLQKT